jgi:hypothetical protein
MKVTLNNTHVIDADKNLLAGVVKSGPGGQNFNFSYDNIQNENMFIDLGNFLVTILQIIPNGVLLMFSSSGLLNKCKKIWFDKNNIMVRI